MYSRKKRNGKRKSVSNEQKSESTQVESQKRKNEEELESRATKKQKTEIDYREQVFYFIADQIQYYSKDDIGISWRHSNYGLSTMELTLPDFPWDDAACTARFSEQDVSDTLNNRKIMNIATTIYEHDNEWNYFVNSIKYNSGKKQYEIVFESQLKSENRDKLSFPENVLDLSKDLIQDVMNLLADPPNCYERGKTSLLPWSSGKKTCYRMMVDKSRASYFIMTYDQIYNMQENPLILSEIQKVDQGFNCQITFWTDNLNIKEMNIKWIDVTLQKK
jgi:hypothetical protein